MGSIEQVRPVNRTKFAVLLEAARRDGRPLFVSAPMVRYSKLPFRLLVRDYQTDIMYTPMILAHEFIRAQFARDSDFTTCAEERMPTADGKEHALIAQFASSDPIEFARAAELIAPWVDGVNLNCGCPQSWAMKEGIGCSLMSNPELAAAMAKAARSKLDPTKSVSVKIRISKDLDETKHWIQMVEAAGVDYITIHGRTRSQRSSTPPDFDAIKTLKAQARVPIVANGDVYNIADAKRIAIYTGVDGVMAARGLLENPALFASHSTVPSECVRKFVQYAVCCPIPYQLVLHHVSEMADNMRINKQLKKRIMACQDLLDLVEFVEEEWSQDSCRVSEVGIGQQSR